MMMTINAHNHGCTCLLSILRMGSVQLYINLIDITHQKMWTKARTRVIDNLIMTPSSINSHTDYDAHQIKAHDHTCKLYQGWGQSSHTETSRHYSPKNVVSSSHKSN